MHGAMNERFELVPDKRYSDTRHIVMVQGPCLGWLAHGGRCCA